MSSDEWTTITRRKNNRKHPKMSMAKGADTSLGPAHAIAPAYGLENIEDFDLTLDQLKQNYAAQSRRWKTSSCRQVLFRTLDRARAHGDWKLNKAFCLASGSFSRWNQTNNRRALLQFAAFIDISMHLETTQEKTEVQMDSDSDTTLVAQPIKKYAQDPAYTSLDKRLLQYLGVQYIHAPKPSRETAGTNPLEYAEPFLNEQTFLFEPFIERRKPLLRDLYSSSPSLYIGSKIPHCIPPSSRTVNDYFSYSDAELVHESMDSRWGRVERKGVIPLIRVRYANAVHFAATRLPGKYFPRFEEEPAVFEGLMVYYARGDREAVEEEKEEYSQVHY